MPASPDAAPRTILSQLAGALDHYEEDVGLMVDSWLDLERYASVSGQVEEIRELCAALPQLGLAWVELLIAHAELVHGLWQLQFESDAPAPAQLPVLRARHADAVAALRRQCGQTVAQAAG